MVKEKHLADNTNTNNDNGKVNSRGDSKGTRVDNARVVRAMRRYVDEVMPRRVADQEIIEYAKGVDDTVRRLSRGRAPTCASLGAAELEDLNTADFKKAVFDENRAFGIMYPKTLCSMLAGELDAAGVADLVARKEK